MITETGDQHNDENQNKRLELKFVLESVMRHHLSGDQGVFVIQTIRSNIHELNENARDNTMNLLSGTTEAFSHKSLWGKTALGMMQSFMLKMVQSDAIKSDDLTKHLSADLNELVRILDKELKEVLMLEVPQEFKNMYNEAFNAFVIQGSEVENLVKSLDLNQMDSTYRLGESSAKSAQKMCEKNPNHKGDCTALAIYRRTEQARYALYKDIKENPTLWQAKATFTNDRTRGKTVIEREWAKIQAGCFQREKKSRS